MEGLFAPSGFLLPMPVWEPEQYLSYAGLSRIFFGCLLLDSEIIDVALLVCSGIGSYYFPCDRHFSLAHSVNVWPIRPKKIAKSRAHFRIIQIFTSSTFRNWILLKGATQL